jgi:hypothetical protein
MIAVAAASGGNGFFDRAATKKLCSGRRLVRSFKTRENLRSPYPEKRVASLPPSAPSRKRSKKNFREQG